MSFDSLKKNRAGRLDQLKKQLEEQQRGGYTDPDADQYWQPTVDQLGNGYAKVRFMPEPEGETIPYQKLYNHSFQDPETNLWYIENSLITIGLQDPVTEYIRPMWNDESKKPDARRMKDKLYYVVNILVLEDPAKPEHEGNVYKWKIGKKLFEKLNDLMNPKFPGEVPVNPFDFWEGADFKVKIVRQDGYRNYDKSGFDSPSALYGGDEERLRVIYEKLYPLKAIVDPKNFKTYEELEAKFKRVIGLTTSSRGSSGMQRRAEDDAPTGFSGVKETASAPETKQVEQKPDPVVEREEPSASVSVDDEDDDLAFFAKMAAK